MTRSTPRSAASIGCATSPCRRRISSARASQDINAILLELTAPQDAVARHSMRLRLYADAPQLWHRPIAQVNVLLRSATNALRMAAMALRGVASYVLGAAPPASSDGDSGDTMSDLELPTCFACADTFDTTHPAVALDGCQHPAILHAECLRADFTGRMELGYPTRCPVGVAGSLIS